MSAESATQDRVDARHEGLITEIESSEAPIGPVLKSVYEDGYQQQFLEKLDDRIKAHGREIERMCNYHYQGFVESVNELIKVRADARTLKIQVKKADEELQNSGGELIKKLEELEGLRVVQRNIVATIETLTHCMPVLDMYAKLKEQISSKRYYLALRTLEQLEHTYLPRLKNFRFTEIMKGKLPSFREGIKYSAMEDLMLFLENVRAKSETLGYIAMKQAYQRYSLTVLHGVDKELGNKKEKLDTELDKAPVDLVDFSPVYRCLHIFTALGEREYFEQHYRKERKQQSRLAFEWQRAGTQSIHESLDAFQAYFHQIVGFFIVEDTILNTTEGLVTRGTVDELWEEAVQKIGTVLYKQCSNLEDVSLMLKVKELIVWFSQTLSGYGFGVTTLYDVVIRMREQYNEMLAKNWAETFTKIGSEDNYTPLFVESQSDYTDDIANFPSKSVIAQEGFPKLYPFSAFVPRVFAEIKRFVTRSIQFNGNLNMSRTEIDQSVRKSTNFLLTKVLSGSLKSFVSHPSLSLAQLAQISVNTMHLEEACPSLEKFISDVTGTTEEGVNLTRLYGSSTFKDVRAEAEQQIFEKLNHKIDDFISLASYSWTPSAARTQPSEYLVDLIAYLQGAFITFESLPGDVATTACLSSCKHLAEALKSFIACEEVKQMNMNGLFSFAVDLKKCEDFVASKPVGGFEEGLLEMTFIELRQIVDLLVKGDWSTFCAEYVEYKETRNRKYDRVTPNLAAKLYEKLTDNKKGLHISVKKADREKKKHKEAILKKLRSLETDGHI